ncbi:MAG: FAD:protein FMN transferase [Candidatus Marinimicrobia bacterium]|nr:FAD:protein FMN transferase [Candidatus Neomarinimicrobiota bacterium]
MKLKSAVFSLIVLTMIMNISCTQESLLTFQGSTMGTWYTIKVSGVEGEHDKKRVQLAINTALTKIDNSLNIYNSESEISRFNDYNESGAFPVSNEFMMVTQTAEKIYEKSNGAFDPTVKKLVGLWGFGDTGIKRKPDISELSSALEHIGMYKLRLLENGILKKDPKVNLDYSAIAKGFGVDLVMEEIVLLGYENVLIEIGGEIRAKGKRNGKPWRIGIAVPDENNIGNQQSAEVITLNDLACATSGDYQQFFEEKGERFTHLINPKTGYPIKHDITSVTVVAETCMLADAAATAAIVLGKTKGLAFIESLEDVEAFFIYREGNILKPASSSGWKKVTSN